MRIVRFVFFAINSTNYLEGLINSVDISNIALDNNFLMWKNRKLDVEKPYFIVLTRAWRQVFKTKNRKLS